MIAFDFEYYQPVSIEEVHTAFEPLHQLKKEAVFYSGGTEFLTFARKNELHADAVIDLKRVPACRALEIVGDQLVIGAAVTLNELAASGLFPLLGETVKQVADHTSRNKITIGGNLNSRLMYKEGVLPFLVADAQVRIAGENEEKVVPLEKVFNKELKLKPGEFLVQILVDQSYLDFPFAYLRRTRMSKVGYPLISAAALLKEGRMRVALSGVCEHPFRSVEMEAALNEDKWSMEERVVQAAGHLPSAVVDDMHATKAYRAFLLTQVLTELMEAMEVAKP